MDVFTALSVKTRREIVELLAGRGQMPATDISRRFRISPPAVSQHLKVLREAKIVDMEKNARQRLYSINPRKFSDIETWTKKMLNLWNNRFSRMDVLLNEGKYTSRIAAAEKQRKESP